MVGLQTRHNPHTLTVICAPLGPIAELRVRSGVFFLRQYSPLHEQYPSQMFERRIHPSLPLGQFLYFTDAAGQPAAFCNWAWLSGAVLKDVLSTGRDLLEDEFQCGDQPFFYEMLAPFGHCREVVRRLRQIEPFKGRRIPAIRGAVCAASHPEPRVSYFCF